MLGKMEGIGVGWGGELIGGEEEERGECEGWREKREREKGKGLRDDVGGMKF